MWWPSFVQHRHEAVKIYGGVELQVDTKTRPVPPDVCTLPFCNSLLLSFVPSASARLTCCSFTSFQRSPHRLFLLLRDGAGDVAVHSFPEGKRTSREAERASCRAVRPVWEGRHDTGVVPAKKRRHNGLQTICTCHQKTADLTNKRRCIPTPDVALCFPSHSWHFQNVFPRPTPTKKRLTAFKKAKVERDRFCSCFFQIHV